MDNYKQQLKASIKQYQIILNKTQVIEKELNNPKFSLLTHLTEELKLEMKRAKLLDSELTGLDSKNKTPKIDALLETKLDLMQQVFNINSILKPRIKNMQAIKSNELKKIKHGRTTATGYAQYFTSKTGRIINSSE